MVALVAGSAGIRRALQSLAHQGGVRVPGEPAANCRTTFVYASNLEEQARRYRKELGSVFLLDFSNKLKVHDTIAAKVTPAMTRPFWKLSGE